MNKLAITSVIAYYMDQHWALREVQLARDEGDSLFCSDFESYWKMIGPQSTHCSMAGHIFEGSSSSFWVYQRPLT